MKKVVYIFSLFLFILVPILVYADEQKVIDIYLFYSKDCPHCQSEKEFLNEYKEKKNIEIHYFEVNYNKVNAEKLDLVKDVFDESSPYVPFTVIGSKTIVGYSDDTSSEIKKIVEAYQDGTYIDFVDKILNKVITKDNIDEYYEKEKITINESNIKIPLLGEINPKKVSIMLASAVIGLVDGFNPCAMWVLIFLISMLINMKDRKKMWILGITFLVTSALIYLAFMMSWLTIVVNFTNIKIIQIIIGILAVLASLFNFRNYYNERKKDAGCQIVDESKRKKTFAKIKKFTSEKSIFLSIIGVIGLAISVNIVELACSAGLPVVFSNILAINNITGIKALLYLIVYILFFLLDDLIIFTIAMISFKVTGLTTKYTKYSHLIGAIIMLLIGILMIFKPNWLMFNFS